ncbi:unnamed protein product [Protopolystoma xenopodis]|uniref:Uncharacterized protein n=1 Tax=Protopolystoma xenopodis TaxID=117903 RepID=A0A3S5FD60_9PLAT|nr:unnamed protein product [Protopolystoma xenopodis]
MSERGDKLKSCRPANYVARCRLSSALLRSAPFYSASHRSAPFRIVSWWSIRRCEVHKAVREACMLCSHAQAPLGCTSMFTHTHTHIHIHTHTHKHRGTPSSWTVVQTGHVGFAAGPLQLA